MTEAVWVVLQKEMQQDQESEQSSTECAWCNDEQGLPQGNGSHGICEVHAEQKYQAWRERRDGVS